MTDHTGQIKCEAANRGPSLVVSEFYSYVYDSIDVFHDRNLYQLLTSHVVVSSADTTLNGHIVSRKTAPIDSKTLVARCLVGKSERNSGEFRRISGEFRRISDSGPILDPRFSGFDSFSDRITCSRQILACRNFFPANFFPNFFIGKVRPPYLSAGVILKHSHRASSSPGSPRPKDIRRRCRLRRRPSGRWGGRGGSVDDDDDDDDGHRRRRGGTMDSL